MGGKRERLENYNVRLPREMIDKLPAAKLRTGKKIQDIFREGLQDIFRKVNL